jgi:hypothetical protein
MQPGQSGAQCKKPNLKGLGFLFHAGADCRFRTGHLMITNQLLYQMS